MKVRRSRGLVVKVIGLHPASLGSIPAGSHMNRYWHRKGIWPNMLPCASKSATLVPGTLVGMTQPLNKESVTLNLDVKFRCIP